MESIHGRHITTNSETPYDPQVHALMEVMDGSGDTKNIWDPAKPDEVAAAKLMYETLVGKGYRAFRVTDAKAERGEQMKEFDPTAGRMIMIPQMRGG